METSQYLTSSHPAFVIGVGGYSGVGKTTLIESALPFLRGLGLSVGVIKHSSHHFLEIDMPGKDTDRFYQAGADFVVGQDSASGFLRYRVKAGDVFGLLQGLPRELDLIIVEGFRNAKSMMKTAWLDPSRNRRSRCREGVSASIRLFRDDPHCLEDFIDFLTEELDGFWKKRPLNAGLLIGGKSSRMGRPKALLKFRGRSLLGRSLDTLSKVSRKTVLLGSADLPAQFGSLPCIPDAGGIEGPASGLLSALRWDPASAWIISATDLPFMSHEAWLWLLGQRRPGIWAVLPRLSQDSPVEATAGCYEPMITGYIESLCRQGISKLQEVAAHPKVATPVIPADLAGSWMNVNTPADWEKAVRSSCS